MTKTVFYHGLGMTKVIVIDQAAFWTSLAVAIIIFVTSITVLLYLAGKAKD